ncbi:MAG: TonB-dependent receptor [Holophagaceae bacterium]|nr:TonB-dependent receptor [Holophagaceae bacterium]
MTKRINISCLTTLGLLLAASPALVSQISTGQINGRVTDSNGNPIARATITLTAPQLMGQRQVTADENGQWIAALLPPGDYTIRFSANGFIGASATNIRIGVGSQLRQDRVLRTVSAATETVDIIGSDNTIVDKTDTRTASNLSGALMLQLSGGRSIDTILSLTAGANGRSIRGGQSASVSYRLNGSEITNPVANTDFANAFMSDQVEDMAVVLSPTNARFGRVIGGAIDIVTKSGGNDFTGSIRFEGMRRNSWSAKSRTYNVNQSSLTSNPVGDSQANKRKQVNLGGPIIKDRLWFTVGSRLQPNGGGLEPFRNPWNIADEVKRSRRTGHPGIDALTAVTYSMRDDGVIMATPDFANGAWAGLAGYTFPDFLEYPHTFQAKEVVDWWNGKITWAVNQNHKIEFGGHKWVTDATSAWGDFMEGQEGYWWNNDQTWNMAYTGILGSATFLEVKVSRAKGWNASPFGDPRSYYDGQPQYPVINLYTSPLDGPIDNTSLSYTSVSGSRNVLGRGMGLSERNSTAGGINLTMHRNLFDINHHLDIGIDYFQGDGRESTISGEANNATNVGGMFERTRGDWLFPVLNWVGPGEFGQSTGGSGNIGLAPWRTQYYGVVGDRRNRHLAFYLNDQMTINERWNVMAGLRYDQNSLIDIDDTTILDSTHLSPRLTLTYDPKGDSSHVFKFSYMFVQQEYHSGFVSLFTQTSPRQKNITYVWTGLPGQPDPGTLGDIINGQEMYGLRFVTLQQLMDPNNYGNPRTFGDGTRNNTKDPNITPPHSTEYSVEYRRNYGGGSYFRTAYVYRKMGNFLVGRTNYRQPDWVVLDTESITGQDLGLRGMYSQTTHYFNTDDVWRDYHGLELETFTRINSIFSLRFNYTRSQLRGDTEADYTGTARRYNQDVYLDSEGIPMEWRAPSGALGTDQPHRINATVVALQPVVRGGWISYALNMSYTSGGNWNITRAYPMGDGLTTIYDMYRNIASNDPNAPSAFGPPATWTKYYGTLGSYHNNDSYTANAVVTWEIPIWKKVKTMGDFTVSNMFNMVYHPSFNTDADAVPSAGTRVVQLRGDRYGRYRNTSNLDGYTNSNRSISVSMGIKF